jgi:hypothetical protein
MTLYAHSQIMLYISAENELSDDAQASVSEIRASAPLDGICSYILLDKKRDDRPEDRQRTVLYKLNPGMTQAQFDDSERDLLINKDMADPRSLKVHLGQAQIHFEQTQNQSPQQKLLFFWGHGGGQVMLDEEQGEATQTAQANIRDFARVLSTTAENGRNPLKFDVIAFDACYMAMLETMHELEDATQYVLCSSTKVSSKSYPYEKIFNALKSEGSNCGPAKVAELIALAYDDRFSGDPPPGTRFIFICNMGNIAAAMNGLNAVGEKLAGFVSNGTTGDAVRAAFNDKRVRLRDSELNDGMANYTFAHKLALYLPGILNGVVSENELRQLEALLAQMQAAIDRAFLKTTTRPRSRSVSPLVWTPLDVQQYKKKREIYHKLSGSKNGQGGWAKFWGTFFQPEL